MKKELRKIVAILNSQPTMEGAGVRLQRVFGFHDLPRLDPFLLLDHFGSENPADYLAGFPWHPHRGIETVTYMHQGLVEHGDSLGNRGVIASGDVQWMTAGSGIIHQEMPKAWPGPMRGFQLWVNLPAASKMMGPRYREIKKEQVVGFSPAAGVQVKIIAGKIGNRQGPVKDLVVPIEYLDVVLQANAVFRHSFPDGWKVFAYVYEGQGIFTAAESVSAGQAVVFGPGAEVEISAREQGLSLLLVSGRPLAEPVAWGGPIVMNTQEELETAFNEYRSGTFIKNP